MGCCQDLEALSALEPRHRQQLTLQPDGNMVKTAAESLAAFPGQTLQLRPSTLALGVGWEWEDCLPADLTLS